MKRAIIGGVLVVCTIIMAGMVYARGPMGGGKGFCDRGDCPNAASVTSEQWRKFKAESLDRREQLMAKRFELEKETLKSDPDTAKIDKLQSEMASIQTALQDQRTKAGLVVGAQNGFGCRNGGNKERSDCKNDRLTYRARGMGRCWE